MNIPGTTRATWRSACGTAVRVACGSFAGRVGIGQAWTADAWAGLSQDPDLDGDAASWSARLAYTTRD